MPNPTDPKAEELLELAAKLEAARGPDRGLDRAIQIAVTGVADPMLKPDEFTASLDAAMTLAGTDWYLSCLTERDQFNKAKACFTEVDKPCRDAVGSGAYMELALCAAALRARAAS